MAQKTLTTKSGEVAAFIKQSKAIRTIVERQPRIVFALDATASREPTWEQARRYHRELFDSTLKGPSVAIQLCYYRGLADFFTSPWLTQPAALLSALEQVDCVGGATQIERLLQHYVSAGTSQTPVRGLIFIGDAVEEPEERLIALAGQCGIKKQPIFIFQEGTDTHVARIFENMARLSGGAYARFNEHSAATLQGFLGAVVRFAQGGRDALRLSGQESDKLLLSKLPKGT